MSDTPDLSTCLNLLDSLREDLTQFEKEIRHEHQADIKDLSKEIAAINERIEERTTALKDQINKLDRGTLIEGFTIKRQVAEIGWRVGLVLGVAIFLLNFVFKSLSVSDFLGGKPAVRTQGRGP